MDLIRPKLVGRFAVVGLVSTGGFFILANVLVWLAGIGPTLAGYIAYAAMIPLSFIGHRKVTFQSGNALGPEWVRFCLCQIITVFVVWFMTEWGERSGWPYWIAFAVISVLIPIVNFITMQIWVFRPTTTR